MEFPTSSSAALLLIFLINLLTSSAEQRNDQNYKESLFIYPSASEDNEKRGERDVPLCPISTIAVDTEGAEVRWESACNLVQNRWFYPLAITRLCRCPNRLDCPWEFSPIQTIRKPGIYRKKINDPYTLMVNNRLQLKFCNDIASLPRCTNEMTLTVKLIGSIPFVQTQCYCPVLRRWTLISSNTSESGELYEYRCERLPRCKSGSFCGHITSDFASYYECSCPQDHLCTTTPFNQTQENQEPTSHLFYQGQGTKAYCIPDSIGSLQYGL